MLLRSALLRARHENVYRDGPLSNLTERTRMDDRHRPVAKCTRPNFTTATVAAAKRILAVLGGREGREARAYLNAKGPARRNRNGKERSRRERNERNGRTNERREGRRYIGKEERKKEADAE